MRWWLFAITGVLAYLVFIVATLPAQHAINLLTSNGLPIVVNQSTGSIWDGEASQISYNNVILGPTKWQFAPLGLFQGQIKYRLELNHPDQTLSGIISKSILSDSFTLSGIKGHIHADSILKLMGQSNVNVSGRLDLDLERLDISRRQITSAQGKVHWLDAKIQSPIRAEAGNLQFILSADETIFKSSVEDLNGPLKVKGEISLLPDGSYQIQGKVKSTTATNKSLVSLLQSIGRPMDDGSTQIDYSGQL